MEHKLHDKIVAEIPGAIVKVDDFKNDGAHFNITVESELFVGKSLLQQHQMVYKALGESLKNEVHAVSLNTKAIEK